MSFDGQLLDNASKRHAKPHLDSSSSVRPRWNDTLTHSQSDVRFVHSERRIHSSNFGCRTTKTKTQRHKHIDSTSWIYEYISYHINDPFSYLTQWAYLILISQQSLSWSINSPLYMESEVSLPCSPATGTNNNLIIWHQSIYSSISISVFQQ
jgi:hypothetical protein